MLRIIMENGMHNFVEYVDPSGKLNGYQIVSDLLAKNSADLVSSWEKMRSKVEKAYADFFAEMP